MNLVLSVALNGTKSSYMISFRIAILLVSTDILVEQRKVHMGAHDCNPLLLMQFLPKLDLRLLANPFDDLPDALEVSEAEYAAHHFPKVYYQENSIRIFCRGPATKCLLFCHVFEAWLSECEQQYSGMIHTFDEQPFAAVQIDDGEALTQEEPDPLLSPQPVVRIVRHAANFSTGSA